MVSSRQRLLGAALVLSAVGFGCSDDDGAPFTTPNATMADALLTLPLAEDTAGDLTITINDYSAAAAAMDVEPPPDDAGPGEARDWIDQLFGGRLDLRPPELIGASLLSEPDVVRAELGWSPYDIEVSAEITASEATDDDLSFFTVLAGDLTWADNVDLGDGVGSFGTADDDVSNDAERSSLRPLGRPIRTGTRDGLVAASRSTEQMRQWVAGTDENAASDPGLHSAADRLDAVDAYSARLFREDFEAGTGDDVPEPAVDEEFAVVGIGIAGEFAELTATFVYVFADDDIAGRVVDQVDDGWQALDVSAVDGTFEIETIEQRGDAVVVIARVEDGQTAKEVRAAAALAGLFLHD